MMRWTAILAGAALGAALILAPASAALHPKYYEEARAKAPNVIVLDVLKVTRPAGDSGDCKVAGRVIRAERGERYKAGDAVEILVPCMTRKAMIRSSGRVWLDMDALVRSAHGKAYLGEDGRLVMDQYQLYDLH